MIILVSNTFDTYKAQIRSSVETGFKQLYTASCTSGERAAAQAVVRKFFTDEAADSVEQLTDPEQVRILTGDFKANPQRKQVFTYWTFNHQVKAKAKPTKDKGLNTKNAAKPQTTEPAPDPEFAAARKHADTIRTGLRRTVAACVALGLELEALKGRIGAKVGRPGKCCNNSNLKWPERVAQETRFSYERCQHFIKAAKEVRKRLTASRKKGGSKIKLLVQSPPSEWADADYDAFADAIGANFDCDTFKALWADLFPAPNPQSEIRNPKLIQGDFYQAMLDAHDCVASPIVSLHLTAQNPEQFVRHLDELPLNDQDIERGDRTVHIHGLRTLQTVLSQVSHELERVIKAKAKSARAPKAAIQPLTA